MKTWDTKAEDATHETKEIPRKLEKGDPFYCCATPRASTHLNQSRTEVSRLDLFKKAKFTEHNVNNHTKRRFMQLGESSETQQL